MEIKILFFGIIKDIINKSSLEMKINNTISISELKIIFFENFPKLKDYNFTVAVNEVYQEDTFMIKNKDIIALIPPVSGG
ncbi:MAG: MoaD/ThiS family protein [Flavobacteriaceae bacterium]|nr:MoaD/ThiS family protein [Flavobacteriaceae bacterium]